MAHFPSHRPVIVEVPTIEEPIQPSPGFAKKQIADYKLDICGLCQFGCVYCSSNHGNYLRIRRKPFATLTEKQTGTRTLPADNPDLMFAWREILENMERQLRGKPETWGEGQTLVFSMLTDGFSPHLVTSGVTESALRLVLEKTRFRIRVLTKNAIVGSNRWIKLFQKWPDRFVVGLSAGTLDNDWARLIERKTSLPTARIRALNNLQEAGVPTFGMLCPTFPHALEDDHLERLVEQICPELVEHVWAEPFNDRDNWMHVRDCLPAGHRDRKFLNDVYEDRATPAWSNYAAELYRRLRARADRDGWLDKLRYLLYEDLVIDSDAATFDGLKGVLLQSKPDNDGKSRNKAFAALQA